ncbi:MULTISPECIES: hypothetical protein [Rhizobium]|nr:hypothetical protein [Rhizobium phaseoli]ARM14823.1 hypothetical protein Bra5_PB00071 [Rhizobium phaseoli Brasil 5]
MSVLVMIRHDESLGNERFNRPPQTSESVMYAIKIARTPSGLEL